MKKYQSKSHKNLYPEKTHTQYGKEIFFTYGGLIITCVATLCMSFELVQNIIDAIRNNLFMSAFSTGTFLILILFLIYGGILYQITRLSYLKRTQSHTQQPQENLEEIYEEKKKKLTVLVPSYKEQKRVISMTLMSAALQNYPSRRIVLLIDDPPANSTQGETDNLRQSLTVVKEMNSLFLKTHSLFLLPYKKFVKRILEDQFSPKDEIHVLAELYQNAAIWHKNQAQLFNAENHAEEFFVREILEKRYEQLMTRRTETLVIPAKHESLPLIKHHYKILITLFSVEISSFERKRYENLSHAPNKAMNLNSYIGLIGKNFKERQEGSLLFLEQSFDTYDFSVPDTDYIITLDADSLILPDYALRLMHFAEKPENTTIAVLQTPYSAFPGATPGKLEYTAGATTDIQYLIHQGFTAHNATFWVGANALLRKKALLDIKETNVEQGYPIHRFIQDRTVIEDTESSVDLIQKNWTLYNY
jgi:cellulose synthase (UDP-forming)